MEYFVSPDGVAGNDGSVGSPWPLTTGISALSAGDILYLRQGIYLGPVKLQGSRWTPANPVVIRSFPGEHATIDGTVGEFRTVPNGDWVPGQGDEYISAVPYDYGGDNIAQGTFLGPGPYTRLITYSTLEDLQAHNQLFGPIAGSDQLPGPTVSPPDPSFPRRP